MISAQKINTRSIYQFVKRKKPIHWSQRYETRDIDKKIFAYQRNELYESYDPSNSYEYKRLERVDPINHKAPIVSLDESHHRDNPTQE